MKQKLFFIHFQALLAARKYFKPETAPLSILATKTGSFYDFTKMLIGHHIMGHNGTGLKFSITIDL